MDLAVQPVKRPVESWFKSEFTGQQEGRCIFKFTAPYRDIIMLQAIIDQCHTNGHSISFPPIAFWSFYAYFQLITNNKSRKSCGSHPITVHYTKGYSTIWEISSIIPKTRRDDTSLHIFEHLPVGTDGTNGSQWMLSLEIKVPGFVEFKIDTCVFFNADICCLIGIITTFTKILLPLWCNLFIPCFGICL